MHLAAGTDVLNSNKREDGRRANTHARALWPRRPAITAAPVLVFGVSANPPRPTPRLPPPRGEPPFTKPAIPPPPLDHGAAGASEDVRPRLVASRGGRGHADHTRAGSRPPTPSPLSPPSPRISLPPVIHVARALSCPAVQSCSRLPRRQRHKILIFFISSSSKWRLVEQ